MLIFNYALNKAFSPLRMATAPVLETSTKPNGCINLINASNFSADPVNSKTKD
jgi:hypothetical protein